MKTLLLAVLLAFVSVTVVHGQTGTGMELLKFCQEGQLPLTTGTMYNTGYCDGLVRGVAMTARMINAITVSDDVTGRQLQLVVIKYLSDHPESLNQSDATLVFRALMAVYPYKK
jgi:hypothetical protein